ncbi:hypothetical protein DFJ74DRAFT_682159 [Hyaloraphidium curvatum]|nr:hypothetical protein DFJ74DRAFT_682159 [Hyaloraphidium curvatum]
MWRPARLRAPSPLSPANQTRAMSTASAIPELTPAQEVEVLSAPFVLPSGINVPNRIWKAACTEGLADPLTNLPNAEHFELYRAWAAGGSGAILTGNVLVDRERLEGPRNVVLDRETGENKEAMKLFEEYARACKGVDGSVPVFMQINHPGRQGPRTSCPDPVAPSAVPIRANKTDTAHLYNVPRALTLEEIADLKQRFVTTAVLAQKAGFDGVQVHSAHGYLLASFLTPLANVRTDAYGGSAENRRRLLCEIVAGCIEATRGGKPFGVGVKLNTSDLSLEGGLDEEEALGVVEALAELGADFIEVSGGSYEDGVMLAGPPNYAKESTKRREAFFLHFSVRARQKIKDVAQRTGKAPTPMLVTGGFKTRRGMAIAVATGDCEFVGLGRSICVEPDLPARMLRLEADSAVDQWNVSWGLGDRFFPIGRAWTWFQIQLHYIAQKRYELLNKPVGLFPWGLGIMMRDIYTDPKKWWIARKLYYWV